MRTSFLRGVLGKHLGGALPRSFAAAPLPRGARDAGPFDVLIITSGTRVVTSRNLDRALGTIAEQRTPGATLIVCAYNFTDEARAALRDEGAIIVAQREWHWTDDSYHHVRQPRGRAAGAGGDTPPTSSLGEGEGAAIDRDAHGQGEG